MPSLGNPQQEKFARLVAQGRSKREAAEKAGYSKASASSTGTNLAKNPKVSQRIAELQQKVEDKVTTSAAVSRDWVMDLLRGNALWGSTHEDPKARSVGNAALRMIGEEIGMWRDRNAELEQGPGKVIITLPDGELAESKPPNADALQAAGKGISVQ